MADDLIVFISTICFFECVASKRGSLQRGGADLDGHLALSLFK